MINPFRARLNLDALPLPSESQLRQFVYRFARDVESGDRVRAYSDATKQLIQWGILKVERNQHADADAR